MNILLDISFNSYVYPPGKVRPVVNAVAVLNPAACPVETNVGRGRIFIGKSKHFPPFFPSDLRSSSLTE